MYAEASVKIVIIDGKSYVMGNANVKRGASTAERKLAKALVDSLRECADALVHEIADVKKETHVVFEKE